jgi:hypothetical protein
MVLNNINLSLEGDQGNYFRDEKLANGCRSCAIIKNHQSVVREITIENVRNRSTFNDRANNNN